MLIAVPAAKADALVAALRAAPTLVAARIGEVVDGRAGDVAVF